MDGIRAIAILPVLAFHADPALCPGGFVGVDVFFVVSGYLITSQILADLSRGRMSLATFYDRRVRRILPALWTVIVATLVAGLALLHARPMLKLAEAAFAATLFCANLYFLTAGRNYFASDEAENPLLHLWSLGVEEQFYFLFPALCVAAWRWRPARLRGVLAVLATVSFLAAAALVRSGRTDDAFYRLPFRAWEMLAGSLLATTLPIEALASRAAAAETRGHAALAARVATLAGLASVLASTALLSPISPFPGPRALPVVLGTLLLVHSGYSGPVGRLLGSRPLRWIGDLSYGLYLWHWPILVLARHATWNRLGAPGTCAALAVTLLAAAGSRRWIELPLRNRSGLDPRTPLRMAALGTAGLAVLSLACIHARAWPERLHRTANRFEPLRRSDFLVEPAIRRTACRLKRLVTLRIGVAPLPGDFCFESPGGYDFAPDASGVVRFGLPGRTDLVVAGDSHAIALVSGLDAALLALGLGGVAVAYHSENLFDPSSPHFPVLERTLDEFPGARDVLLVEYWLSPRNHDVNLAKLLVEFCDRLRRSGRRVFLATDVPRWGHSPAELAARSSIVAPPADLLDSINRRADTDYEREQAPWNARLAEIAEETGAAVVPLHLAFRRDGGFAAFDRQDGPAVAFFFDKHHLSPEGSVEAARVVVEALGLERSGAGGTAPPSPSVSPTSP